MVGAGAADGSVGATGSGEAAKEKTSSVGAAAVGPSSSGIVAAIGSGSGNSFSIFFSVNIPRQSRISANLFWRTFVPAIYVCEAFPLSLLRLGSNW
jgi:hypothetical protein